MNYSPAALAFDIEHDKGQLGLAGLAAQHITAKYNALSSKPVIPTAIPIGRLLAWAALNGVRGSIETQASNAAAPIYSVALAMRDIMRSGSANTLDVTEPLVVGMLDALVSAGVLSAEQKRELINLNSVPASRAEVLFGLGTHLHYQQVLEAQGARGMSYRSEPDRLYTAEG